jgi:hypothetical protein
MVGKTERLVHEHLCDGEAVMDLEDAHVLGSKTYKTRRVMISRAVS